MVDPVDQMTCPHCGAVGVVEGVAEEVVPKTIQCGHCREQFPYRPSSWDYIREDYDGEQSPFYLRVTSKPDSPPVRDDIGSEDELRLAQLKGVKTRVLLDAYRAARRGNATPDDAWISWSGRRSGFTGKEVQTELALREHVPNKKEGKAMRRALSKGKGRRFDL